MKFESNNSSLDFTSQQSICMEIQKINLLILII